MSNIPPQAPELGPAPGDGNRNLGPVLVGVNWALFTPAWIAVILRCGSRLFISHNFGWDDAVMLIAQVFNSVGMGLVMQEVFWGLGRHRYFLKQANFVGFAKYNFLDWCQVFLTLAISKISICLFLLRISKFNAWRRFLFGMIAFLVLTHLPITLVYIFQCSPVNKAWNQVVPGHCWPLTTVMKIIIFQGVVSVVSDLVLAAFPILLLRSLRLPRRQKIALNALMGLGVITAIASIFRTAFSYEVLAYDLTWDGVPNALCRMLEINLCIIAACMPMCRPLYNTVRRAYKRRFGSTEKSGTTRTPQSRLQWYRPPTWHSRPWHKRIRRHFHWPLRPPNMTATHDISPSSSTQHMTTSVNEIISQPSRRSLTPPPPRLPRPQLNVIQPRIQGSAWPQNYDPKLGNSANATADPSPIPSSLNDPTLVPVQHSRRFLPQSWRRTPSQLAPPAPSSRQENSNEKEIEQPAGLQSGYTAPRYQYQKHNTPAEAQFIHSRHQQQHQQRQSSRSRQKARSRSRSRSRDNRRGKGRPENATWAKDELVLDPPSPPPAPTGPRQQRPQGRKRKSSFDLPLQGTWDSEYNPSPNLGMRYERPFDLERARAEASARIGRYIKDDDRFRDKGNNEVERRSRGDGRRSGHRYTPSDVDI